MKAVLVNYNFTPTWLLESDLDYLIYDRSDSKEYLKDFSQDRIIYTENIGQVDYDKLDYLAENYDSLPEVFLWGKTNLFKSITPEEFDRVKNNTTFTPLLTANHNTYSDENGVVCYYEDGMYYERNDNWYLNIPRTKYIDSFGDFAIAFNFPNPYFIPFPPGGNYILTREIVHKYPKYFYRMMGSLLPHSKEPGEAFMCERAYYLLWK